MGDALFAGYRYVEFAARGMAHFRNLVIDAADVGRYADSYGRYDVYTSMYFYPEKVLEYMKGNIRAGRASISGYDGLIYANYLFIDIDAKRLDAALDVARKILLCFYDKWNCGKNDVTVAFSGNKGFHIGIDTGVFGRMHPSGNLNIIFSELRREISQICALSESERELIDFAISDKTRLWRLINTINAKSGLFKIPLHPAELMRSGVDEIKRMARQKRRVFATDESGLMPLLRAGVKREAREAYLHALKVCRRKIRRFERVKIINEINDERPVREVLCPARYRLFNSHVERGRRNHSALILAAAFREGGFSEDKTGEMIFEWNERNGIGLGQYELRNVVRSVYRAPAGYRFGCRSLKEWCPYEDWRECKEYRKERAGG